MRLAAQAQGLITAIKTIIQPASVIPLRDIRTNEALELLKQLDGIREEYIALQQAISDIQRELGMD
jgi:hypothetical protein